MENCKRRTQQELITQLDLIIISKFSKHVVSKRPRSMNKAWRKRNPVNVSPFSLTPSAIFSDTTFFTPTTSDGCKGALKHLTWQHTNCFLKSHPLHKNPAFQIQTEYSNIWSLTTPFVTEISICSQFLYSKNTRSESTECRWTPESYWALSHWEPHVYYGHKEWKFSWVPAHSGVLKSVFLGQRVVP